jgi:bacterioferritin (cytochrome b1)
MGVKHHSLFSHAGKSAIRHLQHKHLQYLDNENETIRNYRRRIKRCDELGEFATTEQIRQILLQEQDHQIALATPSA